MLVAACYLARCARLGPDGRMRPPRALSAATWQQAFDRFRQSLGRDCPPHDFRRQMEDARAVFDVLLGGNLRNGRASIDGFLQQWQGRSDGELEQHVLAFLDNPDPAPGPDPRSGRPGAERSTPRPEGRPRVSVSSRPERNPRLRAQAIAIHGLDCAVCGFNFEAFYGQPGKGFIEVHHLFPFAQTGPRDTNPKTDLTVLCANCHHMVHRRKGACMSLDELKGHIEAARGRPVPSPT